ncbi:MAG: ATP-binding cassette domain-containing protein, partial [Janthinobacterium lividum]
VLGTYAVAFVTMNARHTIALTHINRTAGAASLMSSGLLGDAILNVDTVKYFGALSSVSQRFSDSVHRVEAIWSSFYRKRISGGIWRGLAFVATLGTCICYAVHRLLAGEIGIGDFVLINAYVFQVCRPLEGTAMAIRDVRQGLTQMEPYFSIIEQSIIEAASDDVLTVSGSKNPIVFERVDFAYSSQRRILKSVSFEIPAGTITAIVGETGSGKSTIAKLLFGLYPPDEGQIWIEGEPLTRGTQERIARRIAVVPQDIFLFQETIAFNIGIARPEATILEIIQAAERANVHTLIDALPEKYETRIGVNGLTLSGGERQRLAIARALLKDPDIIIFDEATSSLDVLTEDNIIKDLLAAIDGKTLILIAHRFSSIKVAHQVIVMEGGAVADIGTPSELAKRDGWYKKMMAIQSTATDSNSRGV